MNAKSSKQPRNVAKDDLADALGSDNSLDTVRDILFGAQARETEKRTNELQAQLREAVDGLKSELLTVIDELRKELRSSHKRIDDEIKKNESGADQGLTRLDEAIKDLDKETSTAEAKLANHVDAEVARLGKSLQSVKDELTEHFQRLVDGLDDAKTDRHDLADLLVQVADELNGSESDGEQT